MSLPPGITPNRITILRICLIPLYLLALFLLPHGDLWAAGVFLIASLSDMLDGNLARKYDLVTTMGKFIDPLADKMLVLTALISLLAIHRLPVWVVLIILWRELAVDGLRIIAAEKGVIIVASRWGKLKTLLQMIMIEAALLIELSFLPQPAYTVALYIVMSVAVIMTVYSGVDYFRHGLVHLRK